MRILLALAIAGCASQDQSAACRDRRIEQLRYAKALDEAFHKCTETAYSCTGLAGEQAPLDAREATKTMRQCDEISQSCRAIAADLDRADRAVITCR